MSREKDHVTHLHSYLSTLGLYMFMDNEGRKVKRNLELTYNCRFQFGIFLNHRKYSKSYVLWYPKASLEDMTEA